MSGPQAGAPAPAVPDGARREASTAPPAPVALALRLPAVVTVSCLLAVVGHVLAGEGLPGPYRLAAGALAVALLARPLRGRTVTAPAAVTLLLAAQGLLHAVLCGWRPAPDPWLLTPDAGSAPSGAAVLAGHAGAALVAGWWLARGEAWARGRLRSLLLPAVPHSAGAPPVVTVRLRPCPGCRTSPASRRVHPRGPVRAPPVARRPVLG